MSTLALHDIEPELLEELARRAKHLGTTIEREALRALREHLAEPARSPEKTAHEAPPVREPPTGAPAGQTLDEDPRFVRQHGLWVFTGVIDPSLIPDHRDLREERIESLVKASLGESSD